MNVEFTDTQNNAVEFRNIRINADLHMCFELFVNSEFKQSRYIHKSLANVNLVYEALIHNLSLDYNKVFLLSQKYV